MNAKTCPEKTDLENYLAGSVSLFHLDSIGQHLQKCSQCLQELEQIEQANRNDRDLPQSNGSREYVDETACHNLANKILACETVDPRQDIASADETTDYDLRDLETTPKELGGYRLNHRIGSGGMGVVWNATQISTRRAVALKVISTIGQSDSTIEARFEREIELAASLEHAHIARVYEGGKTLDNIFYAMELIDGLELGEYVDTHDASSSEIVQLLIKICRGIEYAHQNGVIHRDLKPQNVLIDQQGEPYITDFGLAKHLGQNDELTMTGQVMGTPNYMAPEQITDSRRVSTAADIYGLGAILYRLLTGQPPMSGGNAIETMRKVMQVVPQRPSSINRQIDFDLDTICLKCLEKNPKDRFASVSILLHELERWQRGEPIISRPVSVFSRVVKWAKRRPIAAATLTAFVGLTLISVGLITWKWLDADRQRAVASFEAARKAEYLYVAHMNMIQQAWESGLTERARDLLDRHSMSSGKPDLRTFEWFYFDSLLKQLANTPTIPYGEKISAVAVDPSENQVALSGDDLKIQIWNPDQLEKVDELKGHLRTVKQIRYSDNGLCLISMDDGEARVWQKVDGKFQTLFQTSTRMAYHSRLSSSGRFLAVLKGKQVELFDATTKATQLLTGHEETITGIRFLQNETGLVSASNDGTVRLWNLNDSTAHTVLQKESPIEAIEVSDDDEQLAFFCDNQLSLQRLAKMSPELKLGNLPHGVRRLVSLNNGRTFAAESSSEISFWSFKEGKYLGRLNDPNQFRGRLSVARDGQHFASSGSEGVVYEWDSTHLKHFRTHRGHSNTVYDLAFLPDGRLLTGSRDNTAKIWNETPGRNTIRLSNGPTRLWSSSFSPDSRHLAVACEDARVVVWDTMSGELALEIKHHTASVQFVRYSPDGKLLASASRDNTILFWDIANCKTVGKLEGHTAAVNSIDFSPDGKLLVSGANDGQVIIWEVASGKRINSHLSDPRRDVWAVAFSKDGQSVVYGGLDRTVNRWKFDRDLPPKILNTMLENITSLNFSPDGKLLSSTTSDGVIAIIDHVTGTVLNRLVAHSGDAMFATFSPDGETLVSGGHDGSRVQFWNLKTGEPTVWFAGDGVHIHNLSFAPNNKMVAAVQWDGQARVWKIDEAD